MTRSGPFRTSLAVESLEGRSLPAGNLVAVVTEGLLTILGDGEANGLTVTYNSATGQHRVTGNVLAGSATTVNGVDSIATPVEFGGVREIEIRSGAGDDQIDFGSDFQPVFRLEGPLTVQSGDGNDVVEVGRTGATVAGVDPVYRRVVVGKAIYVDGGAGNDQLKLSNLKTNKSLIVHAGEGNDQVSLVNEFTPSGGGTATATTVQVKGNLQMFLEGGDDTLLAQHLRVKQNMKLIDLAGKANINLGDVIVGENLDVATGNEQDLLALDYIFAKQFRLSTAGGADDVDLRHGKFKRMNANFGAGEDELTLRQTQVSQYTYLNGGPGNADIAASGNKLRGLVQRGMG